MHYGLINWFLGKGPMAEPDTRFMASYLAAVGALAQLARDVDLELAANELARGMPDDEARAVFAAQADAARAADPAPARERARARRVPRAASRACCGAHADDEPVFADNPIRFLRELYHYLQMEENPDTPPSEKIWEDDAAILGAAEAFYAEVARRTGARWYGRRRAVRRPARRPRRADDDAVWRACVRRAPRSSARASSSCS